MLYVVLLLLGFVLGWFVCALRLGRYFAWVLTSSIEFGGSRDELAAYKNSLDQSMKFFPLFMRRFLWIKNRGQ